MMVSVRSQRPHVSPLHTKGMLTLGLVLIAESITVSNAVKLWSTHQGLNNDRFQEEGSSFSRVSKQVQECFESDAAECPSSTPTLPPIRRSIGRLTKRLSFGGKRDCCTDCSHCIDYSLEQCNTIPRGGHSHVVDAAKKAADAAEAVMPYGIPLNGWKVLFQAFLTTLNVLCWLVPLGKAPNDSHFYLKSLFQQIGGLTRVYS